MSERGSNLASREVCRREDLEPERTGEKVGEPMEFVQTRLRDRDEVGIALAHIPGVHWQMRPRHSHRSRLPLGRA